MMNVYVRKKMYISYLCGQVSLNNWNVGLIQFSAVTHLCLTLCDAARQASLSITNSPSLLKLMSVESVMPSNHLILCHSLLFLPWLDYITRKG